MHWRLRLVDPTSLAHLLTKLQWCFPLGVYVKSKKHFTRRPLLNSRNDIASGYACVFKHARQIG